MSIEKNRPKDEQPAKDIDPRCAGYRRPPGTLRLPGDSNKSDSLVISIKNMLQGMLGGLLHGPSKHSGSSASGMKKAVEKRRARNKMARKSRRINRLYA